MSKLRNMIIIDETTADAAGVTASDNLQVSIEELATGISDNSNSQLKTTLYGSTGTEYKQDSATGSFTTISYEHHEIHGGSHYEITTVDDITINNVIDVRITTPNTTKWAHFTFALEVESETAWFFHEGAVISTVGTAETAINNNRNSANTSGLAFDKISNTSLANANSDTDITGATELKCGITGTGKKSLGSELRTQELILKQNTIYNLRIIANAAGYVNRDFEWYEHTDL